MNRETKEIGASTPLLETKPSQSEEVLFEDLGTPQSNKWRIALWLITGIILANGVITIILTILNSISIFIAKWILVGSIAALLATFTHLQILNNYEKKSIDKSISIRLLKFKKISHKNIPIFMGATLSLCLATIAILVGFYFPEFNIPLPLILSGTICYLATTLIFIFYRAKYISKFNDPNYSFSITSLSEIPWHQLFAIGTIVILWVIIVLINIYSATFLSEVAFWGINAIAVLNTIMVVITAFLSLRWLANFFLPTITPTAKLNIYIKKLQQERHGDPEFCRLLNNITAHTEHGSIPPKLILAMCDILAFLTFKSSDEQRMQMLHWLAETRENLMDAAKTFSYIPPFNQDPQSFEHLISYLDDSHHLSTIFCQLKSCGLLTNSSGSINKINFRKLLQSDNKPFFRDIAEIRDSLSEASDSNKRSYWNLSLTYPDCTEDINCCFITMDGQIEAAVPLLQTKFDVIKFMGRKVLATVNLGNIRAKPFLNFEDLTDEKEIRSVGKILYILRSSNLLNEERYQTAMQCSRNAEQLVSLLSYLVSNNVSPERSKIFDTLFRIIQVQGGANEHIPHIFEPLEMAIERILNFVGDQPNQDYINTKITTILLISPALISLLNPQDFPINEDIAIWEIHLENLEIILRFLDQIEALEGNYQKLINLINADNTKSAKLARIACIIPGCSTAFSKIVQKVVFQMIMDHEQPDLLQEEDILQRLEAVKLGVVLEENNSAEAISILPLAKDLQNTVGDFFIPEFAKFREAVHAQFSADTAKRANSKAADEKYLDSKQRAAITAPADQPGIGLGESRRSDPPSTGNSAAKNASGDTKREAPIPPIASLLNNNFIAENATPITSPTTAVTHGSSSSPPSNQ